MPLAPKQQTFERKIANFPEDQYTFADNDHLTRLMKVLLEDSGVGQIQKVLTVARISETLQGSRFGELEFFFGTFLRFPRLPNETYDEDPFVDVLTSDRWRVIENLDASYRSRIKLFLHALSRGGTVEGLSMAAEAASGVKCKIYEVWRVAESTVEFLGRSNQDNEFVVVPESPLDGTQKRSIYKILNRIKPANTLVTVEDRGLAVRSKVDVEYTCSASEYFEVRKFVTGVDIPEVDVRDKFFWVRDGEELEVPSYAMLETMEKEWSLNGSIQNATTYEISTTREIFSINSSAEAGGGNDDVDANRTFGLDVRRTIESGTPTSVATTNAPLRSGRAVRNWSPWLPIPVADSPDNFPNGRSPESFDRIVDGQYQHPWASQEEFEEDFVSKIQLVGGQVSGGRYRLPANTSPISSSSPSIPTKSISSPSVSLRSVYYA